MTVAAAKPAAAAVFGLFFTVRVIRLAILSLEVFFFSRAILSPWRRLVGG